MLSALKKYADACLILLMTVAFCAELLYQGPPIGWDESVQLGTAIAFVKGQGFTMPIAYNPTDLSETTHEYLIYWPPTYAFFNSLVYSLVGDITWSALIIELVFVILFGVATFILMHLLHPHLKLWVRIGILLFWTFIYSPLFGATNTHAMVLYYMAITIVLADARPQGIRYLPAIIAGCLVGLATALRYSYAPVLIVLPVTFITIGLLTRVRRWHYAAIINGVSATAFFAATWLYNRFNSGDLVRTDMLPQGFFLENLNLFYPLGSGTLGVDYGLRYLVNLIGATFIPYQLISWLVSFVVIFGILGLSWYYLRWIQPQQFLHASDGQSVIGDLRLYIVVLSGLLLFTLTLIFLMVLSVTNPPEVSDGQPWKYITGDRYYASIKVWLILMLGFFLSNVGNIRTRLSIYKPTRLFGFAMSGIILIGMFGSALQETAFWRNRLMTWQPFKGATTFTVESTEIFSLFMTYQTEDRPTVALWGNTFDRRKMAHFVWMSGAHWYDGDFDDVVFSTTQPLRVIVIVPLDQPADEFSSVASLMAFVEQYEAQIIYQVDGWAILYLIDL